MPSLVGSEMCIRDSLRHVSPLADFFFSWCVPERAAPPLLPLLEPWASTMFQASTWSIILRRTALGFFFHPSTYVSTVRTRLRKSEGEIPSIRAIDTESVGPGRCSPLLARYKASTSRFSQKDFPRAELNMHNTIFDSTTAGLHFGHPANFCCCPFAHHMAASCAVACCLRAFSNSYAVNTFRW